MTIGANIVELGGIVAVQFGFPFRGSINAVSHGSVSVVQMKDVEPDVGVHWPGLLRTELPGLKKPDWLRGGDILFISRGTRFYAVCLDAPPTPSVCNPHFLHLRVMPNAKVLPGFVAWQINQPPFQRQLQQAAEGSSQLSIRRPVLESLKLSVPNLAAQQRIVALAAMARRERQVLQALMRNREQQLQMLAEKLASHPHRSKQEATHP